MRAFVSSILRRVIAPSGSDDPRASDSVSAGQHVWCLAVRGQTLYAGGADGHISVFLLPQADGKSSMLIGELRGHEGTVYALHVRGTSLISGGADGALRVWKCSSTTALPLPLATAVAGAPDTPVLALAGAASGALFSGGADGHLRRWEQVVVDGTLKGTAVAHAHSRTCYAVAVVPLLSAGAGAGATLVSEGGVLGVASAGNDAAVHVWHAETLERLLSLGLGTSPSAHRPLHASGDGGGGGGGGDGDAPPASEASYSFFCLAAAPARERGGPARLLAGALRRTESPLASNA